MAYHAKGYYTAISKFGGSLYKNMEGYSRPMVWWEAKVSCRAMTYNKLQLIKMNPKEPHCLFKAYTYMHLFQGMRNGLDVFPLN